MKPIIKNSLVFIVVICASALFLSSAVQAAEKTITAHIEIDSQLGTTKIEDMQTRMSGW